VIAREDPGREKRLLGYVVAQSGQRADPELLRGHLAQSLPEYMDCKPWLQPTEKLPRTLQETVADYLDQNSHNAARRTLSSARLVS
jgi:hypothetical protein